MLLSNKYHRLGAISLHIALLDSFKPLQYFFTEVFSNRRHKYLLQLLQVFVDHQPKYSSLQLAPLPHHRNSEIEIFDKIFEIFEKNNWNIWQNISSSAKMEPVRGGQDRPPCLEGLITRRKRVVSPEGSKSEQCFWPNSKTQYDHNRHIHDLTQRHIAITPISQVLLQDPHSPHSPTLQSCFNFSFACKSTIRVRRVFLNTMCWGFVNTVCRVFVNTVCWGF